MIDCNALISCTERWVSYFVLVYNINSISIKKKAIYDLIDGNINLELQRTSKRLSNRE